MGSFETSKILKQYSSENSMANTAMEKVSKIGHTNVGRLDINYVQSNGFLQAWQKANRYVDIRTSLDGEVQRKGGHHREGSSCKPQKARRMSCPEASSNCEDSSHVTHMCWAFTDVNLAAFAPLI